METIETVQPVENQLIINNEIKGYLLETSKWGKFLAIIGYVGMGFLVLMGVAFIFGFSFLNSIANVGYPIWIFGFVYILIALLYYFPVSYLYKSCTQMKRGLNSADQQTVTSGFENLKSLYKFMGIFTIVVLSLYVLIIIVAVPIALLTAAN